MDVNKLRLGLFEIVMIFQCFGEIYPFIEGMARVVRVAIQVKLKRILQNKASDTLSSVLFISW